MSDLRIECTDCGIHFTPAKAHHQYCSDCIRVRYLKQDGTIDDFDDVVEGSDLDEVDFDVPNQGR